MSNAGITNEWNSNHPGEVTVKAHPPINYNFDREPYTPPERPGFTYPTPKRPVYNTDPDTTGIGHYPRNAREIKRKGPPTAESLYRNGKDPRRTLYGGY